jgi:predicted RNA polymerase sigma factor
VGGPRDEDLLRRLAPEILGALVRRYGHFDLCEDAVQEALLVAATQWPAEGLPDNPPGWLITVASRRLVDLLRAEQARREREATAAAWQLPESAGPGEYAPPDTDDTLVLLFMCCHPALSAASQIALTLRAVAGLTTRELARAFLVSEETMTRRITRAKRAIEESHVPFRLPGADERPERLGAVRHTLYLIFNEGYVATSGPSLERVALSAEALRLTRMLRRLLPDDAEVAGLLALMLLTLARRAARAAPDGALIPMAEQDRGLWDAAMIEEGVGLVGEAMALGAVGPYQLQAAIAALHDRAADMPGTDWPQILALYDMLVELGENPVVRLNRAVAVAMVQGPEPALAELSTLEEGGRLEGDHRLHSVRAHLQEMAGDPTAALASYEAAARTATSLAQKRYLTSQARRLGPDAR